MSDKSDPEVGTAVLNIGTNGTAVPKRGRPSNRQRNIEAVAAGEAIIIEQFEEMIETGMEIALGRKPEVCPYHHEVLSCAHVTKQMRRKQAGEDDEFDPLALDTWEEYEDTCGHQSKARSGDAAMLRYMIDRVAGRAAQAGEKQIKIDFVRRVANHVTVVFQQVNDIVDPEDRAHAFAEGVQKMWLVMSEE